MACIRPVGASPSEANPCWTDAARSLNGCIRALRHWGGGGGGARNVTFPVILPCPSRSPSRAPVFTAWTPVLGPLPPPFPPSSLHSSSLPSSPLSPDRSSLLPAAGGVNTRVGMYSRSRIFTSNVRGPPRETRQCIEQRAHYKEFALNSPSSASGRRKPLSAGTLMPSKGVDMKLRQRTTN